MGKRSDGTGSSASTGTLTRRKLLLATGTGLAAAAVSTAPRSRALAQAAERPSVQAAAAEGPVVVWHGDQEADVVEFLKKFTEKTGLQAVQQRLLPGAAIPRLEAEFRSGAVSGDLYMTSDAGIMETFREQGRLLRYVASEMDAYGESYRSAEPGWWTTYYINAGPMMYDPRFVKDDEAPKTWTDLLDPKWQGQIGFQNSSAGTSYAFWFVMRDVLPKDFFDKLATQKPRAYASSTQIQQDIERGNLKIGGRVSVFQYVKAMRAKNPVRAIFPQIGTPSVNQVVSIFGPTKRPNGAKIFVDYLLSREGQQIWNDIQGSPSARADVKVEHVPDLATTKLLLPVNFAEYRNPARRREFVATWNKMTGL
ncbi:MAG: extracellular solute-binding protein [Variibacter sp.]|nr:extracellular solute-binding protein [Variibacter sp.]